MNAQLFFILAAIFFAIDGLKGVFGLNSPVGWTALGFCAVTIGLWLV